MSAQLLHRAGTKRVAGCDQHGEAVLDQPIGDLRGDRDTLVQIRETSQNIWIRWGGGVFTVMMACTVRVLPVRTVC